MLGSVWSSPTPRMTDSATLRLRSSCQYERQSQPRHGEGNPHQRSGEG